LVPGATVPDCRSIGPQGSACPAAADALTTATTNTGIADKIFIRTALLKRKSAARSGLPAKLEAEAC